MSFKKKMIVIISAIIILALAGCAVFVVLSSQKDKTVSVPDNANGTVEEKTNTNEIIVGNDGVEASNRETITTSSLSSNDDEDWAIAEQFATLVLDRNKSRQAVKMISNEIPKAFQIADNSVTDIQEGYDLEWGEQFSQGSHFKVMTHSCLSYPEGRYTRHMMIVGMQDDFGATIGNCYLNVVTDKQSGQIIYVGEPALVQARAQGNSLDEYNDVVSMLDDPELDDAQRLRTQIALMYSYSPDRDQRYWDVMSDKVISVSSDWNTIVSYDEEDDVAERIKLDWHPGERSGQTVAIHSIGTPELYNANDRDYYYHVAVTYRTVDENPNQNESMIGIMAIVHVDPATKKITSFVESDPSVTTIRADFGKTAVSPMEMVLFPPETEPKATLPRS